MSMFKGQKKVKKTIHSYCKHGNEALLRQLLEKEGNEDVNSPDPLGRLPLHLAAAHGHKSIVELLLEHGADMNAEEPDTKWNVLIFAAKSGNAELFHYLVTHPDIKVIGTANKDNNYPAHYFCREFAKDVYGSLETMFEKGASANAVNYNGETALHNAAWKGNVDVCALLLKRGAAVNAVNDRGETALHWAARQGHEAVVRYLLRNGADSAALGLNGTPFDVATPAIKEVIRIEQAKSQQTLPPMKSSNGGSLTELRKKAPLAWEVNKADVEFFEEIGQGSFGVVKKGKWKGITVAAKFLKEDKALKTAERFEAFLREVTLMSKLRHPNILLLLGACVDDPMFYLTEYMAQGSLRNVLDREKNLAWERKLALAIEIGRGLEYLHGLTPPVLHHDLKSHNILIDDDFHARVADFGMSSVKSDEQILSGTLSWMAPEVVSGEGYTEKSDVYSFGIVAWELVTHKIPYEGHGELHVISAIVEGMHPEFPPATTPSDFKLIAEACLRVAPNDRPSFTEICENLRKMKSNYLETQSSADSRAATSSSVNAGDDKQKPLNKDSNSGRFRSSSSESNLRKNSSNDLKSTVVVDSVESRELRPSRSAGDLNQEDQKAAGHSDSTVSTEITSSSNSESHGSPHTSPNVTPTQPRAKAMKAAKKKDDKTQKRSSMGTPQERSEGSAGSGDGTKKSSSKDKVEKKAHSPSHPSKRDSDLKKGRRVSDDATDLNSSAKKSTHHPTSRVSIDGASESQPKRSSKHTRSDSNLGDDAEKKEKREKEKKTSKVDEDVAV